MRAAGRVDGSCLVEVENVRVECAAVRVLNSHLFRCFRQTPDKVSFRFRS